MSKTITTSVNLSKIDKDGLDALAKKFNISKSEILRIGLRVVTERYIPSGQLLFAHLSSEEEIRDIVRQEIYNVLVEQEI